MAMAIVMVDRARLDIPEWVTDLASFRRWADSDEFPDEGRICFFKGKVWADMSWQQIFSHVAVKSAINSRLNGVAQQLGTGRYWPDGLRLYSKSADLSAVPDGSFISFDAMRSGRVRLNPARGGGYTSVEGPPDLVIEVVSDSSEDKDNEWQMQAYLDAGVREYWVVDARKEPLRFDIYKAGSKGFTATRKAGGWVKSTVFGKSFRLVAGKDPLGNPEYDLKVR
jgi:hypothetical protein